MDETVVNGAQLFYPEQFGIGSKSTHDALIVGCKQSARGTLQSLTSYSPCSHQLRAVPLLCCPRLLVDGSVESMARSSRSHLCHRTGFIPRLHMAGRHKLVAAPVGRSIRSRPWYRPQERNCPCVCCGVCPRAHPWCAGHAMASLDRLRHHDGKRYGSSLLLRFRPAAYHRSEMASYVGAVPFTSSIDVLNRVHRLASAGIPALILLVQVFFCPESPRWLMSKGRYRQAYNSLLRLRNHKLLAARDLFQIQALLEIEKKTETGRFRFLELFTVPRNRRASLAAFIVMFGQQFCGVNVIAYYSSTVFTNAGFSNTSALAASVGSGALNFIFALPGFLTIDRFGRRNLLLVTFPLMSMCLLMTGFAFWIPGDTSTARVAVVALGIYLFEICYSPGEGPVPFTYSAEAFPLYVRELGMSFATAVCWGFNFILSFTWPLLLKAFKPQGAFGWYAAWCMILWGKWSLGYEPRRWLIRC
jgi:hypothetical protein